jgi:hypothetical protein
MRKITIDCDLCGTRVPLEQGKEALFEIGNNSYHLIDLCSKCLDGHLKSAESVNDTSGYRQRAAALIRLPGFNVPGRNA